MDIIQKFIIFMVVTFKLQIYIINQTISSNPLITYMYVFLIFLLALPYILKIDFNKNSFIKTFVILFIAFVMFIVLREDNIFLYAIVALLAMDADDKEIVKTFFWSGVIVFAVTILLGNIGVLPISEAYRTLEGETDIRVSLGFPNANAVFTYFVPIVLAGLYLFDKKKMKIVYCIIALVIATILFDSCKSRAGYYLVITIIILNLFSKNKFINKLSYHQFAFFGICSIILAFLYGGTIYNDVNLALSGRPYYYLQFLKLGPLAWGMGIPDNLIIDNLFLKILANYGVIGFGLYFYIFNKGLSLAKDNKFILFASFMLLLYGIFESVTVVNFVIVLLLKRIFINFRGNSYGKD